MLLHFRRTTIWIKGATESKKFPLSLGREEHSWEGRLKYSAAGPGDRIPRRTPSYCRPEKFRSLLRDILSERWPSNMGPECQVPKYIRGKLLCRFRINPSDEVRIIVLNNGKTECCTDPIVKEFPLDEEYSLLPLNNSYWKLMFAMERCLLKTLLYNLSMKTCGGKEIGDTYLDYFVIKY